MYVPCRACTNKDSSSARHGTLAKITCRAVPCRAVPPHGTQFARTMSIPGLVARAGKGAVMMKRDLKSAFCHIPVAPSDYWLLLFQWDGKYYIDMFLPFGLRTAPRIFNYFAEALHWVFETLHEWNVTHYLDDFLLVFPPDTGITPISEEFDKILSTFGMSKAAEKDSDGCVVIHLGFEFDSLNMEVRLPRNKKQCAIDAVNSLLSASKVSILELESTLGFLSHCCQVVPLGRPFLRQLFSLLCRNDSQRRYRKIYIPHAVKRDLQWWLQFLFAWSSITMIQLSCVNHDIATDASGKKGIGGIYARQVFSEWLPARHHSKHIDWKEMFAVLHAFLLWAEGWCGGRVRLASDNVAVVDAVNKRSIKGETIRPLQSILLLAAIFDIDLMAFWIPSEENIVADAASRQDHKKLANMGLQAHYSPDTTVKALRQKLRLFCTSPSPPLHAETMTPLEPNMKHSVEYTDTPPSLPPPKRLCTGSPKLPPRRALTLQSPISMLSTSSMSRTISPPSLLRIPASTLSSGVPNVSTARNQRSYVSHSQL